MSNNDTISLKEINSENDKNIKEINDISIDLCAEFVKSIDLFDDGNETDIEEDYHTDVEEIVDVDKMNKYELLDF